MFVDRAVIATARELFESGHYASVVAICSNALEDEPDSVPLLMIRARARIALRLDLEAQTDLRRIVRADRTCGLAFRLLGEIATRRNDNVPAAAMFREAVRLDPDDGEANDWLLIVDALVPPERPAVTPARAPAVRRDASPPRFARGTQPPGEPETNERPTRPFASVGRIGDARRMAPTPPTPSRTTTPATLVRATVNGRPPIQPPAKRAPQLVPRVATRTPVVELPGFGDYLVASGILTPERLRAAEAYQRSMKVALSTAIVTLGLATPQRIAWAAIAHQSQQP